MTAVDADYTRRLRAVPVRELPVLDLGPLRAGDAAGIARLAEQLHGVATGIGFMAVVDHGVPQATIAAMFEQAQAFCALPLDAKMAFEIDRHERGYQPLRMTVLRHSRYHDRPQNDWYESYNFGVDYPADDPQVVAKTRMYGRNRWPAGVPGLPAAAIDYRDRMGELALSLLPLWARALGLPDRFFVPYFTRPHFYIRLIHYPPKRDLATDEIGTGAHSDTCFNTLLPATEIAGLQVMDTDGTWIWPDFPADGIVVNFGQYLERWANGRVRATPHRVVPPTDGHRYSAPFFACPNLDAVGTCLPTCTDADDPPRFPPQSFWQFHTEYMSRVYPHFEARWDADNPKPAAGDR